MASQQQQREWNDAKQTVHQSLDQAAGHAKAGVQATVEGVKNNVQDSATNTHTGAKDSLTSLADKSGQTVVQARDGIGSMLDNAKNTVTENTKKTKESAQQNGGKPQEEGKGYLQYVGDMVSQTAVTLKETLIGKSEVKNTSEDTVQQAKEKSNQGVEATGQSLRNLKIDGESGADGQKGLFQALGEKVSQTTQAAVNAVTPAGSRTSESTESDVKRSESKDTAKQGLSDGVEKGGEKGEGGKGMVQAMGEKATQSAQSFKDTIGAQANQAQGVTRDQARDQAQKALHKVEEFENGAKSRAKKGSEMAQEKKSEEGKGFMQTMGDNISQSAASVRETVIGKPPQ